mmetsp:Transcript_1081/g.1893  ORF Transcript_1081/g.1893 Transcript_1081/m.1893 type:complete len:299 (+) Transcript_1081:11-907(+)
MRMVYLSLHLHIFSFNQLITFQSSVIMNIKRFITSSFVALTATPVASVDRLLLRGQASNINNRRLQGNQKKTTRKSAPTSQPSTSSMPTSTNQPTTSSVPTSSTIPCGTSVCYVHGNAPFCYESGNDGNAECGCRNNGDCYGTEICVDDKVNTPWCGCKAGTPNGCDDSTPSRSFCYVIDGGNAYCGCEHDSDCVGNIVGEKCVDSQNCDSSDPSKCVKMCGCEYGSHPDNGCTRGSEKPFCGGAYNEVGVACQCNPNVSGSGGGPSGCTGNEICGQPSCVADLNNYCSIDHDAEIPC